MRNVIYLMFLCFFFTGCGKEDNLYPSKEDRDWFVITDDSDFSVDQAVYSLYKSGEYLFFIMIRLVGKSGGWIMMEILLFIIAYWI